MKGEEGSISDRELVDEIKTFVIAGSETTANFLTAMILYVFEKPQVAEKLRKEIDSVIKSNSDITFENIKKMNFLEAVVNETERTYSSAVGIAERKLTEDTTLCGVPLKKGLFLSAIWIAMMHNPAIFKDPFDFNP